MEGYMSTKEAAEKWNLSVRQVQNHCKFGRIRGVEKIGKAYVIPSNAKRPVYMYVCEESDEESEGNQKVTSD